MKGRRHIAVAWLCAISVIVFLTLRADSAWATAKYEFEPVRSLTGGCGVTALDPVPDPGCPEGPHPEEPFRDPRSVAVDSHGDLYVASFGSNISGEEGRIDVFDATGNFILELKDGNGPSSIAVDQEGRLYVRDAEPDQRVIRYTPDSYPPTSSTTYGAPTVIAPGREHGEGSYREAVAIDPASGEAVVANSGGSASLYRPDGAPDGVDEVQQLAIEASGGSFNLHFFEREATAGTGTVTAGSTTVSSVLIAAGTGTVNEGSTEVGDLVTSSGSFSVGQQITGNGIAAGTTIAEVSRTAAKAFLRLSQPATESGAGVALSSQGTRGFNYGLVIYGPGIPSGTTIESESVGPGATLDLSQAATANGTAVPIAAGATARAGDFGTGGTGQGDLVSGSAVITEVSSATGTGTLTSGSRVIESVATASGQFGFDQAISGAGIPAGAFVTGANPDRTRLTISQAATASGSGTSLTAEDPFAKGQAISGPGIPPGTTIEAVGAGSITLSAAAGESQASATFEAAIPFDASAETVQASLEALGAFDPGDVSVSGGPGGGGAANPYAIAFIGRMANADIGQMGADGNGLSGAEASAQLTTLVPGYDGRIGIGNLHANGGVAVFGGDIFIASTRTGQIAPSPSEPFVSEIMVFDGTDGHLKQVIDGSDTPNCVEMSGGGKACGFSAPSGNIFPAIDQASGDLYVSDLPGSGAVYQFHRTPQGGYEYASTIEHSLRDETGIAFDNSGGPGQGTLYVTSNPVGIGHVYAFTPAPEVGPPVVSETTFSAVTTAEAMLEAKVNPGGEATSYHFEYVDNATFGKSGYTAATSVPIPDASLPAGSAGVLVSRSIKGLEPDTKYHFRLVAENSLGVVRGEAGVDSIFTTYPTPLEGLPDQRGYELVTPVNMGGHHPVAADFAFENSLVTPDGSSFIFYTEDGALPGMEGNGVRDAYKATRGEGGWSTQPAGPTGAETNAPLIRGASSDNEFSFWTASGTGGSLGSFAGFNTYLRAPDGSFERIGVGSQGEDPVAVGRFIAAGARHVHFTSDNKLEPNAPQPPASAIYDRSPAGPTRVVSLLPGDVTPTAGADYLRASADGSSVAFEILGTIYERRNNAETLEVTSGSAEFAGLSEDGRYVFYSQSGDLFRFDSETDTTDPVSTSGDATVVNVSADGSHVYFVSPSQLDGSHGTAGADNLYVWDGASIRFIATVAHIDVTGAEVTPGSGVFFNGLGLWSKGSMGLGIDPSRTTLDGQVLVFQSSADLTGYDPKGHSEVYRYDATANNELICLSCNPSSAPASSDARLQTPRGPKEPLAPDTLTTRVKNLSDNGHVVFFESGDRLVAGDVDGLQDVYEWEAPGAGSCQQGAPAYSVLAAGCLYLISSGHSSDPNYLMSVTPSASDVFFSTTDALASQAAPESGPMVYDARVGGGAGPSEAQPAPCQGDACQSASAPPPPIGAASASVYGPGNFKGGCRHRHRRPHGKKRRKPHRACHAKHRGGGPR